jgi:hypothetical protein
MPTLVGHFASFNEWTEIRSSVEGHFMERVAPGAFVRTIVENRKDIRVLFHHGLDPSIGLAVLGPIDELRGDTYSSSGATFIEHHGRSAREVMLAALRLCKQFEKIAAQEPRVTPRSLPRRVGRIEAGG